VYPGRETRGVLARFGDSTALATLETKGQTQRCATAYHPKNQAARRNASAFAGFAHQRRASGTRATLVNGRQSSPARRAVAANGTPREARFAIAKKSGRVPSTGVREGN